MENLQHGFLEICVFEKAMMLENPYDVMGCSGVVAERLLIKILSVGQWLLFWSVHACWCSLTRNLLHFYMCV